MARAPREQHRGVSITNRQIEIDLESIQSHLQEAMMGRNVGLQMVVDYLLQNYFKTLGDGEQLLMSEFTTRLKKGFQRR